MTLPETFLTHKDVSLRNACKEAIRAGRHPIIYGDLDLSNILDRPRPDPIKSLPDGLEIRVDLKLCGSAIKSLPNGLVVKGNLDLENTLLLKNHFQWDLLFL